MRFKLISTMFEVIDVSVFEVFVVDAHVVYISSVAAVFAGTCLIVGLYSYRSLCSLEHFVCFISVLALKGFVLRPACN